MADLAQWMRSQLDRHNMSQLAASYNAGVGQATVNDEHPHTWQLVEEFRQVPDEWKHEAIEQVRIFVRLAKLPHSGARRDTWNGQIVGASEHPFWTNTPVGRVCGGVLWQS